jgi:nucleoside phosphorylase
MVGIAGGTPSKKYDIRLGDVVVSSLIGRTGGVIHYEFGKTIQNQRLERAGALAVPPMMLLTALNAIGARHERRGHRIAETVQRMVEQNLRLRKNYGRPEAGMDRLYESTFDHPDREKETARLVPRWERAVDEDDPVIHYGLIASADRLMKDAQIRDTLARKEDVLCFEMEAAGFMDHFPCVVIRGIRDYSNTHKNDIWQNYAAATAAVYAKELLEVIQPSEVGQLPTSTIRLRQTESNLDDARVSRSFNYIRHNANRLQSRGSAFNNYGKVQSQAGEQDIAGNMVFN